MPAAVALLVTAATAAVVAAVALGRTSTTESRPTYARDVAPILAAKCTMCHYQGGIAPFPLTTAAEVRRVRLAVLVATQEKLMPPWPPGADSPRFVGQSRRTLTAAERATIARWVRTGAH